MYKFFNKINELIAIKLINYPYRLYSLMQKLWSTIFRMLFKIKQWGRKI